jgi:hypothetical protein
MSCRDKSKRDAKLRNKLVSMARGLQEIMGEGEPMYMPARSVARFIKVRPGVAAELLTAAQEEGYLVWTSDDGEPRFLFHPTGRMKPARTPSQIFGD